MRKVYIVAAKRSPIGSFLGSLKSHTAPALGALVLGGLLESAGIGGEEISEVIVGNILPAGAGQGVGRQVSINAGVPQSVPAYSINMACGSGMKAAMLAAAQIRSGSEGLFAAGGTESMSNAPYLIPAKSRQGIKMGDFKAVDHMVYDALTDAFSGAHMGVTAENIAERYGISRERQDEFALYSQAKAIAAVDAGAFDSEVIPVSVTEGKNSFMFLRDEYPNRTTSAEKLAGLRAAFKQGGTVTAGNASGLNDGAAFVLLAGEDEVSRRGLKPIAELIGFGQGGVDPQVMGMGPVPAIEAALNDAGLKLSDMDYIELNEAFAAQALGVVAELSKRHDMPEEKILSRCNVRGGAIALGHPVGASGNRITITLAHILRDKNARYGIASLCIGGGMGTAVVLKSCD